MLRDIVIIEISGDLPLSSSMSSFAPAISTASPPHLSTFDRTDDEEPRCSSAKSRHLLPCRRRHRQISPWKVVDH